MESIYYLDYDATWTYPIRDDSAYSEMWGRLVASVHGFWGPLKNSFNNYCIRT